MAVLTPGGTSGYNFEKFARTVEAATYQKMKFIPRIKDIERLYDQITVRKHTRASASTLTQSQSGVGSGLTYSTTAGTPVVVTPAGQYVAIAWSANEESQVEFDIPGEVQSELTQALAEASETSACANIATLTNFMSDTGVDAAMFRVAYGRLMGFTNGVATPGSDPQVYGIFSHTQYPNLASIPEFNNAEVRGDSENPNVKGIWMRGGGVMLMLTTVLTEDANGIHNCLFLPEAFVISWNKRSQVVRDRDGLQQSLICFNNFGSAVLHNERAIGMRTTVSAIA